MDDFDPEFFFAPEVYHTDRFSLRSLRPGDGKAYAEARNSSFEHCRQYRRWEEETLSEKACEKWVRTARSRYLANEEFYLGVFAPDGHTLLGETNYFLRLGHALFIRSAAMGGWIRASHAGKGLGSAVLKAMLDWGFSEWPWERLTWHCDRRNLASARIAQKAGMQQEGILRSFLWYKNEPKQDLVCFGSLRQEWASSGTNR